MFKPSTGYIQHGNPFPVTSCGRRRNTESPLRDEKRSMSSMAYNALQMETIRQTEKEIGPPPHSRTEKDKLQRAVSHLQTVRKKYPIKDYSHKKDEYKVK